MDEEYNLPELPCDLIAHVEGLEIALLEKALLMSRYNQSQAAFLLGLEYRALRYRVQKYRLLDTDA